MSFVFSDFLSYIAVSICTVFVAMYVLGYCVGMYLLGKNTLPLLWGNLPASVFRCSPYVRSDGRRKMGTLSEGPLYI